jgi:hypothetical protein
LDTPPAVTPNCPKCCAIAEGAGGSGPGDAGREIARDGDPTNEAAIVKKKNQAVKLFM